MNPIIRAIADLHGNLPEIQPCDILLIAGDVCPATDHSLSYQYRWLNKNFRRWLEEVPAEYVVGICGNHDFIGQVGYGRELLDSLPWIYLEDKWTVVEGIEIYGSPWTPPFRDWAFMTPEWQLKELYSDIPPVDILLSHGPPYRILDKSNDNEHCGSRELAKWWRKNKPNIQALICGHIHEARGYQDKVWNVSMIDASYKPYPDPTIEIFLGDLQ